MSESMQALVKAKALDIVSLLVLGVNSIIDQL